MRMDALKCFVMVMLITMGVGIAVLAGETVEAFDFSEQEDIFEERSLRLKAVSAVLVSIPQDVLTLRQAAQPEIDENFNLTFSLEYGVDIEKYSVLCTKLFSALDAAGAVNLGKFSGRNDDIFPATLIEDDDSGWLFEDDIEGLYSSLRAYGNSGEADAMEILGSGALAAICTWRGANMESMWKFYLLPQDVSELFMRDLDRIQCRVIFGYEGVDVSGRALGASEVAISQSTSGTGAFRYIHTITPGVWLHGKVSGGHSYSVGPEKRIMQHTVKLQADDLEAMNGISIEPQRSRR